MNNREYHPLCGASSYNKKYYFNAEFEKLPEEVQKELKLICVMFTQKQGGAFAMTFDPDGHLLLTVDHEEGDVTYDEAASEAAIEELRVEHAELMQQLTLYYNVLVLGKSPEELGW